MACRESAHLSRGLPMKTSPAPTAGRVIHLPSTSQARTQTGADAQTADRHHAIDIAAARRAWGSATDVRATRSPVTSRVDSDSEAETLAAEEARPLCSRQCSWITVGVLAGGVFGGLGGTLISLLGQSQAERAAFSTAHMGLASAGGGALLGGLTAACLARWALG